MILFLIAAVSGSLLVILGMVLAIFGRAQLARKASTFYFTGLGLVIGTFLLLHTLSATRAVTIQRFWDDRGAFWIETSAGTFRIHPFFHGRLVEKVKIAHLNHRTVEIACLDGDVWSIAYPLP